MNELLRKGVIGLFLVLLGSGGTLYLDAGELEHAYVCDVTGQVGVFYGGISGTKYTGYPNELDRKSPVRCKDPITEVQGDWETCTEYAKARGVSCVEYIEQASNIGSRDILLRQEITDRTGKHIMLVCVEEGQYNSQTE